MSAHVKSRWHIVALTYGCPSCGAMPGQPCRSESGTLRSTEVHVARSNAAARRGWTAADVKIASRVCEECGSDEAVEGHRLCLDCLERRDAEE